MLRRLLVALAQVQAGNTPENLFNGIRQIFCSIKQNGCYIYEFWKQKNIWFF